MRTLNIITLVLVVIGGINWGLIGFFQFNLVEVIFGDVSRLIYALVGLSALWQIVPLVRSFTNGEVAAERNHRHARGHAESPPHGV